MIHRSLQIKSSTHTEMIDITSEIESLLRSAGTEEGLCHVYCPHTTCGLTINENADPTVKSDILMELDRRFPWDDGYRHMEGNSAAHIKASLMGFSLSIPVSQGRLMLGTWQGIYLCEFDGPRNRRLIVSVS